MKRLLRSNLGGPDAIRCYNRLEPGGLPRPFGGRRTFRFVESLIHTESRAKTAEERKTLITAEGRLWRWYMRRILGRKISGAGRPVGTTETFSDPEQFRTIMRKAIQAIKRQGRRPSVKEVAEYLGRHPDGIGFRGEVASIDERQLRRWRERSGYKDWRALLDDLGD